MYLIQLKSPLLASDIESRLDGAKLKPIQPGQSMSSGWVERAEGAMTEFGGENDAVVYATFMVEERKLSKKDIKLEADARAKSELQKYVETGQSRYVCPNTGAVNAKAIRQDVMDELLQTSIPKRTGITVEFCLFTEHGIPGTVIAIHTSNALHLDSVLHALALDDEIEWRITPLDTEQVFSAFLDAEHRGAITSISFSDGDGGSINAKNVDVQALLESNQPDKVKSIGIFGFVLSSKGSLKIDEGVEYWEAITPIKYAMENSK